jgi:serine/threonine-protein kinase
VTSNGPDAAVGRVLAGRYALLRRIADGGMATVYLARDERLDRPVAVKVLRRDLSADDTFVTRFRREATLTANLSHQHIVAVHDFVESDGEMFLVMEYVEGTTLRDLVSTMGALPVREAVRIFTGILLALDQAHQSGLVHRDVKPENVLLREDGTIKVTDFGLARAVTSATRTSTTGVLLGTVSYLAPEQLDGDRADARSDVYAAGLLLYELLTGAKAFQGENPMHVAYQHVHGSVPVPSDRVSTVPLELDRVVARATARDPDQRPADAGELLDLLDRSLLQLSDAELDASPTLRADPSGTAARTTVIATASPTTRERIPARQRTGATVPVTGPGTDVSGSSPSPAPAADHPDADQPGHPDATARPGRRWPKVVAVLLLLAAGAAGGWYWYDSQGPGSIRRVPALVTLTKADAEHALATVELRPQEATAYSEDVPKDAVISADPVAGTEVHKHTAVTLTISMGQERYAVPTLVNAARADLDGLLGERHLRLGTVTEAFSETVPAAVVVSQDPAPGTSVKRDTPVNVVVSKGREPLPVPNLAGKNADEATKTLEAAGFKVARADPVNSDTVPSGAVVSQNPSQGTLLRGDTVTLVVSKGPVLVAVPDVVGKQRQDARRILEAAGFKVVVTNVLGGFFNTVRASDPPAGASVPKGSTVTLTVV